jgi:integrase
LTPGSQWLLMELPRPEDKELIADFILSYSNYNDTGHVMRPHTKKSYISSLVYLSRYHKYKKSFKEMTRQDIIDGYLDSLKKSFEQDPEQKWVNTHNNRASCYLAFWKWLTQPDIIIAKERQTPPQLKGLRFPKRKIKTATKREHFWTPDEHRVFLKYCEDLRLACYHAIAMDTGGRPGELLDLKISDLKIKTSAKGIGYAEFTIGDRVGGKMKKPRPVHISDAIPHFNAWVSVHPRRDSPQGAYLFPSREMKARYRNKPLKPDSLRILYFKTIEQQLPKKLEQPDTPLEDKVALKSLIYEKPHHPYLIRHEFASAQAPTLSDTSFNQLMGHSPNSRMRSVYVHELGNEGNKELMIARGIIDREETITAAQMQLKPKYCPICHESNKQDADFCFKCNWVISKKGMQHVREQDEAAAKDTENVKRELAELKANVHELMKDNLLHEINASLHGKSDRDVADELASGLESAIDEVEARAAKGEKLPILVGKGGSGTLYFSREEIMRLKSLINKRGQKQEQQQQEKKKH